MLENPCKRDCPKRSSTCHSDCEKYFIYDLLNESERNRRFQESQRKDDLFKSSRSYKKKKRRRPYADNRGGY